MAILLDVLAAGIPLFTAIRGLKRGMILTLASILVFILAFGGAYYASATFSDRAAELIQPKVYALVSEKMGLSETGGDITGSEDSTDTSASQPSDTSKKESLREFLNGITAFGVSAAAAITQDSLSEATTLAGNELCAYISDILSRAIAQTLVWTTAFLLLYLILTLLVRVLNLAAKLPGLNFMNKFLGLLLGLVLGLLIVLAATKILTMFSGVISRDITDNTYILRYIVSFVS